MRGREGLSLVLLYCGLTGICAVFGLAFSGTGLHGKHDVFRGPNCQGRCTDGPLNDTCGLIVDLEREDLLDQVDLRLSCLTVGIKGEEFLENGSQSARVSRCWISKSQSCLMVEV